jgi:predicted amidophosphoribosyltransferase
MSKHIEHVERIPWGSDFPDVITLSTVEMRDKREAYKRAKYAKNANQAKRLLKEIKYTKSFKQAVLELKKLNQDKNIVLVPISSLEKTFDPRKNKTRLGSNPLPLEIALAISDEIGCEINTDIVQTNIVGHTGADSLQRFAYPATFSGNVQAGQNYIIIDDHVSSGATVANCRGYIEKNGGKVAAVCALTSNRSGMCLRLGNRMKNKLLHAETFASIGCHTAMCEKIFGYPIECLTNAEALQILYGIEDGKRRKGKDYNLQSFLHDIVMCRKQSDITNMVSVAKEEHCNKKMNGIFIRKNIKPNTINGKPTINRMVL